jgi:hypothetical protein
MRPPRSLRISSGTRWESTAWGDPGADRSPSSGSGRVASTVWTSAAPDWKSAGEQRGGHGNRRVSPAVQGNR